jgi:nitrogen-specific signal transduction histidine kinase
MSHWLEIEREKHASKIKTLTFAQAAHEFRNPLNGIV